MGLFCYRVSLFGVHPELCVCAQTLFPFSSKIIGALGSRQSVRYAKLQSTDGGNLQNVEANLVNPGFHSRFGFPDRCWCFNICFLSLTLMNLD